MAVCGACGLVTQAAFVQAQDLERVEIHHYHQEGGLFYKKKPHEIDGKLVIEEMDKMMRGESSLYYLAAQPIYAGVNLAWEGVKYQEEIACTKRRRLAPCPTEEMYLCSEELLLRSRNGTQKFPIEVLYHLPANFRRKFFMYTTRVAAKRAPTRGVCQQVNWWEQDMQVQKEAIISLCSEKDVVIELTEYVKHTDVPSYPKLTEFTPKTLVLIKEHWQANVKVSLDDVNWVNPDHPCSFGFVLQAARYLYQVKLDIKACSQAWNTLPSMLDAELFAPLELDPKKRAKKVKALKGFVQELRVYDHIQLVIELSVVDWDLAAKIPSLNPFIHANTWVRVQGGLTNDWAMKIDKPEAQ